MLCLLRALCEVLGVLPHGVDDGLGHVVVGDGHEACSVGDARGHEAW